MAKTKYLVAVLAVTIHVSACVTADDDDDGNGDAGSFRGAWAYNPGSTGSITCPGGQPVSFPVKGIEVFTKGVTTGLVVVDEDCNYNVNVTGNRAEGLPGQTCTTPNEEGSNTWTFTSGTYTLSNGALSMMRAGSVSEDGTTCTFTVMGTLKKLEI